jgi:hypothetical protein
MDHLFESMSLKLFIIILACFLLTEISWSMPDDSSQSDNDKSSMSSTQIKPEKEEFIKNKQNIPSDKKEFLTRGQKTILINGGAWATIIGYGIAEWDYNKSNFHFKDEGWFGRETSYAGMDKLSHAWSCYVMSHLFSYLYRKWEYTDKEANIYGTLSSFGVNAVMEIADGFSPSQGFSYEDTIMNILGCGFGYIRGEYPNLAKKIDFRLEYTPKFNSEDFKIGTSYERQKYLIVVKADGFDFIENPYLMYLELHFGYSAHGYDDYEKNGPDDRHRHLYAGLGLNVTKILRKHVNTTFLDYVQLPYTSINHSFFLD